MSFKRLIDLIGLSIWISIYMPFCHADASNTTTTGIGSNATLATTTSIPISNSTKTVDFSSAVQIASSVSWQLQQLASIPAIPIPTDISNISGYEIVSRLAPAMPPIQAGVVFDDTESMIADLIASTNVSDPGDSLIGRQSSLRVMVVGDSMTQGKEGDWTWRYRIWQWFQQNGIAVQFVGPYKGTLPAPTATAPSPPPLYGVSPTPTPYANDGGYAKGVDSEFLSNCNHFSVWGRAAAVDLGLIQGVLEQNPADMMLLMLGFNDVGWFYSDGQGTIDSIGLLIGNARAANPNLKFAVATIPQRTYIGGRDDLIEKTNVFNALLPGAIAKWTTDQSPIHIVQLEENYSCQPGSCPAHAPSSTTATMPQSSKPST